METQEKNNIGIWSTREKCSVFLLRHFKNEVSIFLPNLKGRESTKEEKQASKGRSPPYRPSNKGDSFNHKTERIGKHMELKFVIPNMEKTFGNLEFAGEDKIVQRRINGQLTVLSRSYNLYSDVQRADDIVVVLPVEAGEKHFGFEERVKLVNPRITAEGYKIGTRGFTNYLLQE